MPDSPPPADGYPTVLFTNRWVLDKNQYLAQAEMLATDTEGVLYQKPQETHYTIEVTSIAAAASPD
ncbi:hypothetical protein [Microbulbifer hainanensis]|uniref:hypothetical protein n=1 Tax=Microbulbifer hainanensis TaxID=2735675 RepID=UPI001868B52B|nr:hypothetical protein [Microbulbifer hainanensis]